MKIPVPVKRALAVLIWIGFGLLFFKSIAVRLVDSDLWWHLAHGRIMVEERVFLRRDIFSHSMSGVEWINFEWLSQVLLYFMIRLSDYSAIFYWKIAASAAVLFVLGRCLQINGARGIGLLAALSAGFLILRPRLYERVELASLFFLAVFTFLLSRARNQPPASLKKIPWVLFGLMVLWCNLHGGFIYGVGLLALINIGARWSGESKEYISMVNWSLALTIIATLVNPFGPKLFAVLVEHLLQINQGLFLIEEWIPPSVAALPVFWGVFLLASGLLIGGVLRRRPEAYFWGPSVVAFLVWSAAAQRNVALSAFVLMPFIADIVSKWEKFHRLRSSVRLETAGWAMAFALLIFQWRIFVKPIPTEKVQWSRFPAGACRFLEDQNIDGKMYNSYEFGGYIEWALRGSRQVLMDGRYLFQPLLVELNQLNHELAQHPSSKKWADYLTAAGFNYAVTNYGDFLMPAEKGKTPFPLSPLNAMFPRSDWALVYWDDMALVFVRRVPQFQDVISAYEYRSLWPYNIDQMQVLITSGSLSGDEVSRELEAHEERVGFTVMGLEMKRILFGST